MSHATPLAARSAHPAARPEDERMSAGAYVLQGTAFIGFLLLLFVLAGFRG
ncbi:hypothetical protein [Belnapia sp. F-4-1]|uniref:hypothetical protein n=1 Tax=Belnapia sp. F-4-1 TaxID=1545443 RepID=UPI001364BFE7|nr:hypothetical protein [Belnapia sp. F-4-1]